MPTFDTPPSPGSTFPAGIAVTGTSASESFTGGSGNDTIDGSTGTDTFVLSGKISDYYIKYNRAFGTATITDHRTAGDGTDTLKSIEKLQFSDKTFELLNPARTESAAFGKSQSFLFDPSFYLLKNPDLVPTVTLATAFDNYKSKGAAAGAAPNVSVTDTGVGIPENKLESIFRIDSKLSTPGTDKETGTGLGLILCKEFVEKNNGKITMTSTPGKGSTFSFRIPVGY